MNVLGQQRATSASGRASGRPSTSADGCNGAVPGGGGQRRSDHKSGANEHNREGGDSQTAPRAGTNSSRGSGEKRRE